MTCLHCHRSEDEAGPLNRRQLCQTCHRETPPRATRIDTADVAKLVRRTLRNTFPSTKFSVRSSRYSMGSSIRVSWTDGPTTQRVQAEIRYFEGSTFDGMTDLQSFHDNDVTAALRELAKGCKVEIPADAERVHFGNSYLFCNRSQSVEFGRRVTDEVCKYWGITPPSEVREDLYLPDGDFHPGNNGHTLSELVRIAAGDRTSCTFDAWEIATQNGECPHIAEVI